MSKLQKYLEAASEKIHYFSAEQLQSAMNELKTMSIQKAIKIGKDVGYLDLKWDSLTFNKFYFGGGHEKGLVAHYHGVFTDEGERWKGDVYITWNGSKYDIEFGGSADKLDDEKEKKDE